MEIDEAALSEVWFNFTDSKSWYLKDKQYILKNPIM